MANSALTTTQPAKAEQVRLQMLVQQQPLAPTKLSPAVFFHIRTSLTLRSDGDQTC